MKLEIKFMELFLTGKLYCSLKCTKLYAKTLMASRSKRVLPPSDNHQTRMFQITDNPLKKQKWNSREKKKSKEIRKNVDGNRAINPNLNSSAFLKLFTFQSHLNFTGEKKFNVLGKSSIYIIERRNRADHAVMILLHVPQI